MPDLPATERFF